MLFYLLNFLKANGLNKFIFSLGFQSQAVVDYIEENHLDLDSKFAIESEPLFTGGPIKFSSKYCNDDNVLIVNADTFFEIVLKVFFKASKQSISL
jgi:D-glycero-alpha-D-manno-heptose 1-phosphate guanylyltransferase